MRPPFPDGYIAVLIPLALLEDSRAVSAAGFGGEGPVPQLPGHPAGPERAAGGQPSPASANEAGAVSVGVAYGTGANT